VPIPHRFFKNSSSGYIGWRNSCLGIDSGAPYTFKNTSSELEFLKRLWGQGTEEEEGYCTGPPGYISWRNSFLGINSGAPYTFKNTSSVDNRCVEPDPNNFGRLTLKQKETLKL
jgi:hypothetical protein